MRDGVTLTNPSQMLQNQLNRLVQEIGQSMYSQQGPDGDGFPRSREKEGEETSADDPETVEGEFREV